MDWIQTATAFSAAAAGAFTIVKTLAVMDRRKANSPAEKERRALFLNGDKEEVIRQIQYLVQAERDGRRDRLAMHSDYENLENELRELNRRLDHAGIPR